MVVEFDYLTMCIIQANTLLYSIHLAQLFENTTHLFYLKKFMLMSLSIIYIKICSN